MDVGHNRYFPHAHTVDMWQWQQRIKKEQQHTALRARRNHKFCAAYM